jgi:glycine cleavage system H protein
MTQHEHMATGQGDGGEVLVAGYALRLDRDYHTPTHMWVRDVGAGRFRIGLDALTADTYGVLAQLILLPPGTEVVAGTPLGSLEAAKFVGPLVAPFAGMVIATNTAVLDNPEVVMSEPYDGGWLMELEPSSEERPLPDTLSGPEAVAWFEQAVADHQEKGLVAE